MKKTLLVVSCLLLLLLLATNALWLLAWIDLGSTIKYRDQQVYELCRVSWDGRALAVALARDVPREEVIRRAHEAIGGPDSFEKDGATWIGFVGLRFSEEGQLSDVPLVWEPDYCSDFIERSSGSKAEHEASGER